MRSNPTVMTPPPPPHLLGRCDGLNGKFLLDGAVTKFAGGEAGGAGRFEDPELRDIAANADGIMAMLVAECGVSEGSVIADVGAGTGLFLSRFSAAVGANGRVWAVELSQVFADFLKKRAGNERLNGARSAKVLVGWCVWGGGAGRRTGRTRVRLSVSLCVSLSLSLSVSLSCVSL
jgi:hypothetical protein